MPMGKTFTLFYLYDNLNKDKVSTGNIFETQFKEFSDIMHFLDRGKMKPPDKIVNRIIEFSRNKNY